MNIRTYFLTVFLSLLFTLPILAQSHEWGEITEEELLMEGIEEDPEADAVILFNTCRIQFTPNFELETFYHKRIKILTEAGKEYANIEVYCGDEDKIYSLDAVCYTIDGKEHELDDDNVFEEKTENWKRKKFTIPGVEVGSVIEYRYQTWSKYIGRLKPWAFQEHDYTKYSEIMVYLPYGFTYTIITFNVTNDQLELTDEILRDPYNSHKKCTAYKWVARDMPGIKKEPYMTAFSDYIARILFQLVSYKDLYQYVKFAENWDDITRRYWDSLKGNIKQDGGIEDFTKTLINGLVDPVAKVEKIYDYVRWEIRTIGTNYTWGDYMKEPEDVFEDKEGSINDKNILLINMLNHAGIEAQPLYISTRNNGAINPEWATAQQFNRVIAYVNLGKKTLFLNSGDKYCPMGYLTPEYDVKMGFLLNKKEQGKLIKLQPKSSRNRYEVETVADLMENGQLSIHSHIEYQGMNGITERDHIDGKDLNEFISKKIETINSEAQLDSFFYSNIDSCKEPLILDLDYHIPDYLEEVDTLAFLTIPLLTGKTENIFIREKRTFPVDFEYKQVISEKVIIKLADCFQINELPEKSKANMTSLHYSKVYFTGENSIECNRSYNLKRTRVSIRDYPKLKRTYENIVNSDQDQVVLTRK